MKIFKLLLKNDWKLGYQPIKDAKESSGLKVKKGVKP